MSQIDRPSKAYALVSLLATPCLWGTPSKPKENVQRPLSYLNLHQFGSTSFFAGWILPWKAAAEFGKQTLQSSAGPRTPSVCANRA